MSKVIVQPLIEALSELVSQVSAIIVVNKKDNKAPPQELPMCVMGIQKAAAQLTQVAKQLADDEYDDFPTIQDEIICGADDVENGAKELNESVITLVKGSVEDRGGAWNALGEAVRIMAQNTAILLHIVYGAEIKKIFALSNYAGGKLKDLLNEIDGQPTGLYEKNPQLFVNKVQAAMEDVQKLAQGVNEKAKEEEDDEYARKELEEVATKLLANVDPFVNNANKLLAEPASADAKAATVANLKDMITAAEKVGAPKPKQSNVQSFIPEMMDIINKMHDIEPATPEGDKEAKRLQNALDDISRANKVTDMGPNTRMINQVVDLYKNLDQMDSMVDNPDQKPLGNVDPFAATDPNAQGLIEVLRKLGPDDNGGKDSLLQDAEKFKAMLTADLLPLGANIKKGQSASDATKSKESIQKARQALDDIAAGMGMSPEEKAQVKGVAKINSMCIKLGAMAGSKSRNKQDVFSAAKNLTDLMSEMSALLGMAQEMGNSGGAGGALQSQFQISSGLVPQHEAKPTPKPGSAKKMMKKLAPAATKYVAPVSESAGSRDSIGAGFMGIGAGAEELKTITQAKLDDKDPIITGVRALGEELSALSASATNGDNAALIAAGRGVHENMKTFSAELKKRAAACSDPKAAHELIALSNQLKNWSVQLKILASVKASSGGGKDSDRALVAMAKNIQDALRGVPNSVVASTLSRGSTRV